MGFQDIFRFVLQNKRIAPGEARTHGLQIMRLTRCLLRYGGTVLNTFEQKNGVILFGILEQKKALK